MGSKRRRPSCAQVENWIKQGFGQGSGKSYKPWFYVQDVPSHGTSAIVHSLVTGRVHDYLSQGERDAHLIAEYLDPGDIREQYALLPWIELQEVAAAVSIKYPIIPTTSTPAVMTTDLVVTIVRPNGKQLRAIAVKHRTELDDPRVTEKLWLERYYWMSRGIGWSLHVVEEERPLLAQNLLFFEGALRHRIEVQKCPVSPAQYAQAFARRWTSGTRLGELCRKVNRDVGLDDPGAGIRQLGAAVWEKRIPLALDVAKIDHDRPVVLMERFEWPNPLTR